MSGALRCPGADRSAPRQLHTLAATLLDERVRLNYGLWP